MTGCEARLLFCGLLLHIFWISIGSAAPQSSNGPDAACNTADNTPGVCVDLKRCKKLNDLVDKKVPRTKENEDYFRKNKCGWNNNDPRVCCEVEAVNKNSPLNDGVKPPDCGKSSKNSEKVFGGRPAELGSWPWMVALGYRRWSDPSPSFRCGASLISDRWLLTAAHCLVDIGQLELSVARLGDLDLDNNTKDGASPVEVPVESPIVHPEYQNDRRNYDVALVRLKRPVEFTTLIQPICIFSGALYEKDEYYKKKSPYVIGWGITEDGTIPTALREVAVNMQELKKCSDKYSKIGGKTFTDNLLCAGEPGKDSCQGDSGGPLIFIKTDEARFYLGGVVSAGKECATDYPGLYMKVAKFIPWINKVTGLNF